MRPDPVCAVKAYDDAWPAPTLVYNTQTLKSGPAVLGWLLVPYNTSHSGERLTASIKLQGMDSGSSSGGMVQATVTVEGRVEVVRIPISSTGKFHAARKLNKSFALDIFIFTFLLRILFVL